VRSIARALLAVALPALLLTACTGAEGSGAPTPTSTATSTPTAAQTGAGGAETLVLQLYRDQDADRAIDLTVPGSIPDDLREDVRASLAAVLDGDATVARTLTHEVEGVTITEVDTDDGLRWCVLPDERILIQCRLGVAEVAVDTGDLGLEVDDAAVDLFPDEYQLRLRLRPAGETAVELPGLLTLYEVGGDPAPFLQTQAAVVEDGQVVDQVGRDTPAAPGRTLSFIWVSYEQDSLDADLELRWDEGALPVDIQDPEWWVG
jgi:hypothetical protein